MDGPYRHVISLGPLCRMTKELRRYGLRDASYPFDWNVSSIESTLGLMSTGFEGFLELGNLERDTDRPRLVRDAGSGVAMPNDFRPSQSVPEQYQEVRERYARRVERFQQAVTEPTLFVRYVRDADEFAYLDTHMPEVLTILRAGNPGNDLLLVAPSGLPDRCAGLPVYGVPTENGRVSERFLGTNRQLRHRMLTLSYPVRSRVRNLSVWGYRSLYKRARRRARRLPGYPQARRLVRLTSAALRLD